jgi:hypothetical protein
MTQANVCKIYIQNFHLLIIESQKLNTTSIKSNPINFIPFGEQFYS